MKVKMTIDEALEFADEWAQGMTFHEESRGWRAVCAILASEVRRLRDAGLVRTPNIQVFIPEELG
jgi:hypothetical protein